MLEVNCIERPYANGMCWRTRGGKRDRSCCTLTGNYSKLSDMSPTSCEMFFRCLCCGLAFSKIVDLYLKHCFCRPEEYDLVQFLLHIPGLLLGFIVLMFSVVKLEVVFKLMIAVVASNLNHVPSDTRREQYTRISACIHL